MGISIRFIASLLLLFACTVLGNPVGAVADSTNAAAPRAPIELTMDFYYPDWISSPINACVNQFALDHPDIIVKPFSNLKLPGGLGGSDTTMLMAFAGGIAPDLVREVTGSNEPPRTWDQFLPFAKS